MLDPALVVEDHSQIESINCAGNVIKVVYDSAASYEAAVGWASPLVFVTEGDQVSG